MRAACPMSLCRMITRPWRRKLITLRDGKYSETHDFDFLSGDMTESTSIFPLAGDDMEVVLSAEDDLVAAEVDVEWVEGSGKEV